MRHMRQAVTPTSASWINLSPLKDSTFAGHHNTPEIGRRVDVPPVNDAVNRRALEVMPPVADPYHPLLVPGNLRPGDARWEYTVGILRGTDGHGHERSFSLITNRMVRGAITLVPDQETAARYGKMIREAMDPLGLRRIFDPFNISGALIASSARLYPKRIPNPPATAVAELRELTAGSGTGLWHVENSGEISADKRFAFRSRDGAWEMARILPGKAEKPYGGSVLALTAQGVSLNLFLENEKGAVLHGDRGRYINDQVPAMPLLSHHLSWPSGRVSGDITVDGENIIVTGNFWTDHQTLQLADLPFVMNDAERLAALLKLGDTALNWHWYALNLSDGSDMQLYTVWDSKKDSSRQFNGGTYVKPDGTGIRITPRDFTITPTRFVTVRSVKTPVDWDITVKIAGVGTYHLQKTSYMDDNWMSISEMRAVEGATHIQGRLTREDGQAEEISGEGWGEVVNLFGKQG